MRKEIAKELIRIATILSSFDIDLYERQVADGETNSDGVPNALLKKFADTYKKNYGESSKRKLNGEDYIRWEVYWKTRETKPKFIFVGNGQRKEIEGEEEIEKYLNDTKNKFESYKERLESLEKAKKFISQTKNEEKEKLFELLQIQELIKKYEK